MQLAYNSIANPQYNGNISTQDWGTPGSLNKNFTYSYDNLNRLTAGVSSEGFTQLPQVSSLVALGQADYAYPLCKMGLLSP